MKVVPPPDWLTEPILELPPELRSPWDIRTVGLGEGAAIQRSRVQKLAALIGAPPCEDERLDLVIGALGEVVPGLTILTGEAALRAQADREKERPAGRPRTWGHLQSRRLIQTVDALKVERQLTTDAEALRVLSASWSREARRGEGSEMPKLRSLQTILSRARKLHGERSSTK